MRAAPLAAALCALMCVADVGDPAARLRDPAKEARAESLFREIRCLVCQGESIAESDAALAGDLRQIVRAQVAQGRSDGEIRAWLEARYGPFVLLRPPFSATNALLWASPFIVVLIGAALLVRRGGRGAGEPALSPEELARLEDLGAGPLD
ncbi:MAG TPA: cytochrome c-type biogenesis protein [Caulobacteraceae bacterium]|nr:cytochrome c-type biogenesis protein [Caulobacteraceae bacterium]